MFTRLLATHLNIGQENVFNNAVGGLQAAVLAKNGAEQLALMTMAWQDQHEDALALVTDAANGFPSVKRKQLAKSLVQEAPELIGHFQTCYGVSPLMVCTEFDKNSGTHVRQEQRHACTRH